MTIDTLSKPFFDDVGVDSKTPVAEAVANLRDAGDRMLRPFVLAVTAPPRSRYEAHERRTVHHRRPREGGILVYETFMRGNEQLRRPSNPAFLLELHELLRAFGDLWVVAFEQGRIHRRSSSRRPAPHPVESVGKNEEGSSERACPRSGEPQLPR